MESCENVRAYARTHPARHTGAREWTPRRPTDRLAVRVAHRIDARAYGRPPESEWEVTVRRVTGPILAAVVTATALAGAGLPAASASPTPSQGLERLATGPSSPRALRAEARLRRLESRLLGSEHAAEHAQVRARIRRVKTARQRAGLRPLLPRSSRPRAGLRSQALGDPAQVGRWGTPTNVPVVAVHAILLPTGKVMMVQQDTNGGVAYIWDPVTGQGHRADPPANIWCGGQVYLADGRLLFIGGTLSFNGGQNYSGLNQLYIFDPTTETWTRQVDMRHGRWYPTGMRMPDGRVLITSGWDETGTMTMNGDVEIFTPSGTTGSIERVTGRQMQFYPHWQVLPDGRALLAGPGRSDSAFFDLATYAFADQGLLPESRVGYGSGMLLPGPPSGSSKMFVVGGGSTPNTHIFDVTNPSAGWKNAAPLPQTRRDLNTVLLPDGTLLAVGGNSSGTEGLPQRETLLYTPAADTWTPLADQSEQRAYHSTALLLPDGRVWSGGDNTASGGGNDSDVDEIFEPPYLFRGPRPAIASAPTQQSYGTSFTIQASGSPTRAVLMSPGATTHGNDMNQRHVELAVTPTTGGLTAIAPANANLAPPGDYMLFVLNADGVPSVARWVRLGGAAPPPRRPRPTRPRRPPSRSPRPPLRPASRPPSATPRPTATAPSPPGPGTSTTTAPSTTAPAPPRPAAFAAAGTYTVRLQVTDDDGAPAVASGQVTVGAPRPRRPAAPGQPAVANPSFETGTVGWSGFQGTLAREAQAGAPNGAYVARVTRVERDLLHDRRRHQRQPDPRGHLHRHRLGQGGLGLLGGQADPDQAARAHGLGHPGRRRQLGQRAADHLLAAADRHAHGRRGATSSGCASATARPRPATPSSPTRSRSPRARPRRLRRPAQPGPDGLLHGRPGHPQTGQQATFSDTSTDSDGTIAARAWDLDNDGAFDDGTGATAARSFAAAGTYTVRLQVTDDDGAPATATRQVVVSAAPPPAQPGPDGLLHGRPGRPPDAASRSPSATPRPTPTAPSPPGPGTSTTTAPSTTAPAPPRPAPSRRPAPTPCACR